MIALEDIPDGVHGDVLRRLRDDGDSLTQPRTIDFSVIFPTEQAAVAFCDAIAEYDVEIAYEKSDVDPDRPWDVTVKRTMVPEHDAIIGMRNWIAIHADPLDGENDGWGCFNAQDLIKPSA